MLRGPSGGGKTSLLNILGTIDRASGGRVGADCEWSILHSLGTEILGRVVDEKSSDNFLAKLRLEKIGATLAGNLQPRTNQMPQASCSRHLTSLQRCLRSRTSNFR